LLKGKKRKKNTKRQKDKKLFFVIDRMELLEKEKIMTELVFKKYK